MTGNASAQASPDSGAIRPALAMAVLIPQVDEQLGTLLAASNPATIAGRSPTPERPDAQQPIAELLPVAVMVDGNVLELRCGDNEASYDLLETLYVLGSWDDVDNTIAMVERALVLSARDLYPEQLSGGVTSAGSSPRVIMPPISDAPSGGVAAPMVRYRDPPLDPRSAIAMLADAAQVDGSRPVVATALRTVVPNASMFAYELPRAWVSTAAATNISLAVRAYAQVLLDLVAARRSLVVRAIGGMRAIEREAIRQLTTLLADARAEIVRECPRYFTLQRNSAEAALANIKGLRLSTNKGGQDETLTGDAAELKAALKALSPLAEQVIKLAPSGASPPTLKKALLGLLSHARAALAREVGRYAQKMPVIARFSVKEIVAAKAAGASKLGDTTFSILSRAWKANRAMRARMHDFRGMQQIDVSTRRPDHALAAVVQDAGQLGSAWKFRTYVARAADRVTGSGDVVARRAYEDALTAIGAAAEFDGSTMQQAAGEMISMGAAAKFATRLVPVVNVAFAAWHIAAAVEAYESQHDAFYCTLNLRDALVEAPPSAAGLALDIGMEAVFAFI